MLYDRSMLSFLKLPIALLLGICLSHTVLADSSSLTPAAGSATVTGATPVTMDFPITRAGDDSYDTYLSYHTVDGTAKSGTDYLAASGAILVPGGVTQVNLPVTILGASAYSADKNFSVSFTGSAGAGPSPGFAAPQIFATGNSPSWVTAADINGDGKPDLIITNAADLTVSVLLNSTTPGAVNTTFAAPQNFPTGAVPYSVSVADINGDSLPDLIVANDLDNTVSVYLNTTVPGSNTVTFAAPQTFATGSAPYSVTVADLNNDGRPDLVVADTGGSTVSVLVNLTVPGSMTAAFASQQTFATGGTPHAVTAADINNDGKIDLVVTNSNNNTVSVLLNTTAPGATTVGFDAPQSFTTGTEPDSVITGDINGDNLPDLIVANAGDNTVSVYLNTTAPGAGTASFTSQQSIPTGTDPEAVTVADVNGDGRQDVIVANASDNTVSVLENATPAGSTTASFAAQHAYATGTDPIFVTAADLNSDGKTDLVAADWGGNSVSILVNITSASAAVLNFASQRAFATGSLPDSVVQADINEDGKPDVIIANKGGAAVSVLLNDTVPGSTTPELAAAQDFSVGLLPTSVKIADMNGDGMPDLVVANYGDDTVSVLLNNTTPGSSTLTFAGQQIFATGYSPRSLAIADVNGDGRPDLIVTNENSNNITVFLNTTIPGSSTVTFATPVTFATGSMPYSVAVGDLNEDGKPDVVVTNLFDNTVSVLLNATAPGATVPSFTTQQVFPTGNYPNSMAIADINSDGRPDIVVVNNFDDTISVLLNTTVPGSDTAAFEPQQTFADSNGPYALSIADLNGDGLPDIGLVNQGSNSISALLNTTPPGATTASFQSGGVFATGNGPYAMAVSDINDDCRPDLVAVNESDNTVSVLLNDQYATSITPVSITGIIHYAIPHLSLIPTQLAFGNRTVGNTATMIVDLTNDGGADLMINSIVLGGNDTALFSQSGSCTVTIAVGQDCNFDLNFTPTKLAAANATLTVTSNMPGGPVVMAVTGKGVDTAPTATGNSLSTSANTPVSGTLSASDPDQGQQLTYSIVSPPSHGQVSLDSASGAFTYTPASSYAGSDRFTFQANDGYLNSNIASESITIKSLQPSPTGSSGGGGGIGPLALGALFLLCLLRLREFYISDHSSVDRDQIPGP